MNLDEAVTTFIAESRELLEQMEEALLRIEQMPEDRETINAIFRAAHTIKGSAGLFGFDDMVAFTHSAESVLDRVRSGQLAFDSALVALFLRAGDHIGALVECIAEGREPEAGLKEAGALLAGQLKGYLAEQPRPPAVAARATVPVEQPQALHAEGGGVVETDNWHLSLRFGPEVLRDGMDPASIFRYLATLGRIVRVVTVVDGLPPAPEMDPERCYLGFELAFESDADKAAIEGAFEFVREESRIRILPPHSRIAEYVELIRNLPEADMRIGEMLVKCGSLTPAELEATLRAQAAAGAGVVTRPIGEVLVEQSMVHPPVVAAALEKQKQVREAKNAESQLIRLDAAKLDQLINLIGELIIAGAGANLVAQQAGLAAVVEATTVMSRLVEAVRDSALTLRMVQIGATFNRFQRVVRDVSHELGKEIELAISGAETELDKTVVEKIGDPLMHLVRNAIDHGIEPAEVRAARGKPPQGTVWLNAYHDAGSIVIEVADDGGGLNRDRILQKAMERGLVNENHGLSDREIFNLIFEAGFSTADQVSNLSGRGVGMDVVRRNIQALRGSVELESDEGEGTTVRIRLPLTLAIIDGFLIGVGKAVYVVPLDTVVECIELDRRAGASLSGKYLNLRGEVLPYIRLRDQFRVGGEPPRRENVVVVRYGSHRAGLVVDRLLGEFQTVIKPLGRVFGRVRGLGGFTILGNGEVALILDVPGLVQNVVTRDEHRTALAAVG